MPLLNFDDLTRMFSLPAIVCPECNQQTYQNYCRECDEFYRSGHTPDCAQHSEHAGHRIYPTLPTTPFPTVHSDWALYLDVSRQKHVWIEHAAIRVLFGEEIGTPAYHETFIDMGDRALEWVEKAHHPLHEGKVYAMHFAGSDAGLCVGIVGGQIMVFTPKAGIKWK